MKVLGTNTFIGGKMLKVLKDFGYKGHHNQFRIICKCKSMADANRKCVEVGLHDKIFRTNWCNETGNMIEIGVCEDTDIAICVDEVKRTYITIEKINEALNFNK